jgi:hypothetical protein
MESEGANDAGDGVNERPRPELGTLEEVINSVKDDVIAAEGWLVANFPEMAPVLGGIVRVLTTHSLHVSTELGEAGFARDAAAARLYFNAASLVSIWFAASDILAAQDDTESPEVLASFRRNALGLYVLHEIVHVVQNFEKHGLAQILKDAFGPDELSKFDLVADVAAANGMTIAALAREGEFESANYLRLFGSNVLLAYELLSRAFKTAGIDHKKKRALGLLTSLTLVRLALEANDPQVRDHLQRLATTPAFTSVDKASGTIIALTCCGNPGGWKILFGASADPDTISALWSDPGSSSPERALGILISAYRGADLASQAD